MEGYLRGKVGVTFKHAVEVSSKKTQVVRMCTISRLDDMLLRSIVSTSQLNLIVVN